MGLLRRLLEPRLADPNVSRDWMETEEWRSWPSPLTLVTGEVHHQDVLQRHSGTPRGRGWLVPLAVTLVRDREHPENHNDIRVEVDGEVVGHIVPEIAAHLGPGLDQLHTSTMSVCGVIRGGTLDDRALLVHLWLDHRLSAGPSIQFGPGAEGYAIPWPPHSTQFGGYA